MTEVRPLRIMVLMLYWYPYEGPLMPIYGAVIDDLIEMGHEVTIVSSFPHFRKGAEQRWDEYRGRLWQKTTWHKATHIRTWVFAPAFKRRWVGLIIRALNYLSFNVTSFFTAWLLSGPQDVLFAPTSPPITNGLVARMVAALKGIPYVYNVQDVYPDIALKLGLLREGPVAKLLRALEGLSLRGAACVLVLSENMKRTMLGKGVDAERISIIPNVTDLEHIRPLPKDNDFSRAHGLDNRFVVLYSGNIGLQYGLEFVVDAMEFLRDEDIMFVFVSRGEYKERIMKLCHERGLLNTLFLPFQPREALPQVLASADVSLVTSGKGLSGDSVPSKTLNIMASGRAVIAVQDRGSEVWDMIERSGAGVCVEPDDPQVLANALTGLKNDLERTRAMGRAGRLYAERHFRRQQISAQYAELFVPIV